MGILERVRRVVGGDGDEDESTRTLRCGTCQSTFETTATDDVGVTCPNCGSDAVKPV